MTRPDPTHGRQLGRRLAAVAAACLIAVLGAVAVTLPASAQEVAFTITDERITESSGLATEPGNNRYWTVNDSEPGRQGAAYALDENGETQGVLTFPAQTLDVEAVSYAVDRLWIGDIGDNNAVRPGIVVYHFANPTPSAQSQFRSYDFTYADGPRDAEAMLVDDDGQIFIVSKELQGGIYTAGPELSVQGSNELEKVADAPAYITDGAVLPDGRMVLRSYFGVFVVDPDQDFEVVASAPAPIQPQGESITVALDGETLLLGSEGEQSEVLSMPIPAAVEEVPEGQPSPGGETPTPSQQPSEQAPVDEEEQLEDIPAPQRSGTIVAIVAAVLLAAVGGAVVYFTGRDGNPEWLDRILPPWGAGGSGSDGSGSDGSGSGAGAADVDDEPDGQSPSARVDDAATDEAATEEPSVQRQVPPPASEPRAEATPDEAKPTQASPVDQPPTESAAAPAAAPKRLRLPSRKRPEAPSGPADIGAESDLTPAERGMINPWADDPDAPPVRPRRSRGPAADQGYETGGVAGVDWNDSSRQGSGAGVEDEVDAAGEGPQVGGVDRGEQGDA
ncbi:hypothetical protein [Parenemella sanctibonifatiensis]|uniref:hypothetical protein n=1 Tax=Parenemella sanctibonifatiensis TaxID=2016505 RepID=UPI0011847080|nr:hypothetical protein [Parenemella sanctibonifatiensis]